MGLSKNGRWVEKYTHYKRLENFRAKWIPLHLRVGHYRGSYPVVWEYATKEEAQRHAHGLNEMWKGVRFFHRNGQLLRDGITEEEAFRRQSQRLKESRRWLACHDCGFEHEFDGVGMAPKCPDCGAWLNIHSDIDGEQPKRLPPTAAS